MLRSAPLRALAYNVFASYHWAHQYETSGNCSRSSGYRLRRLATEENQFEDSWCHPRAEEWDTYYRYVGPQQQPIDLRARPQPQHPLTARQADSQKAQARSTGQQGKRSDHGHPPPTWQPSLRSLDHPSQPASTLAPWLHPQVSSNPWFF